MPENNLQTLDQPAGRGSAVGLLLATIGLMSVGVVMVYSVMATVSTPGAWYQRVDIKQAIFAGAAMLILFVAWRFDYRFLGRSRGGVLPFWATILLAIAFISALMVYVPGVGHAVGGYKRWVRIGVGSASLQFQPSELVKICLLIWLAGFLALRGEKVRSFTKTFIPAMIVIGLCLAPIMKQDLGTSIVIGLSAIAVLFLGGVPWYYLLTLLPVGAGGFYYLVWTNPMRMGRLTAFMDVWSQTNPSSYQPQQALMAILSGGWFGKGLGNGVTKLGYLPEDSTDFIFAGFCEEWGFAGAVLLMLMFCVWLWQARKIARNGKDQFSRTMAGGIAFAIGLQATIHMAVDVGAIPATGLNLPFISAGGTALLILAMATCLVASVAIPRKQTDCQLRGELSPEILQSPVESQTSEQVLPATNG